MDTALEHFHSLDSLAGSASALFLALGPKVFIGLGVSVAFIYLGSLWAVSGGGRGGIKVPDVVLLVVIATCATAGGVAATPTADQRVALSSIGGHVPPPQNLLSPADTPEWRQELGLCVASARIDGPESQETRCRAQVTKGGAVVTVTLYVGQGGTRWLEVPEQAQEAR